MKQQITVEQILDRPTKIVGKLYLALEDLNEKIINLQNENTELKKAAQKAKKTG